MPPIDGELPNTSSTPAPAPAAPAAPAGTEGFDLEAEASSIADSVLSRPTEEPETPDPTTEDTPKPEKTAPSTEVEPGTTEAKPGDAPVAADPNDRAPATWKPEEAAQWTKLPPEVKATIQRRELEAAQLGEAYGRTKKVADGFETLFAPHMQWMKATGINPWTKTAELWQAYALMNHGTPEEKATWIGNLAASVGVDIGALNQEGGKPFNPHLEQMQRRLDQQENVIRRLTGDHMARTDAELAAQVDAFSKEPGNEDFWTVADEVVAQLNSGRHTTLASAYAAARKLHPVTYAKDVEAHAAKMAEKAAKEAEAKAAAARKATAANLKSTSARPVGVPGQKKTVDQTLDEAYDRLQGSS